MLDAKTVVSDEELVAKLKSVMWEAGDALLNVYQTPKNSFEVPAVVVAALSSYEVFLTHLPLLTPNIPIVSPTDTESWVDGCEECTYWLVNPLDGEREFSQHHGQFTATLALIEKGEVVFGFVVAPRMEELFCGGPAMRSSREGRAGKPIMIRHARFTDQAVRVVTGHRLCGSAQDYLSTLQAETEVIYASSSLNLIKIATGEADIMPQFSGSLEWDTAAGHAILEGAGGSVTAVDGMPLIYGKSDIQNPSFIASAI